MKILFCISLIIVICISCKIDRNSLDPTPTITEKQKIAFVSDRDGNYEIYIMDIDGNNETRLTNNPGWDKYPQFSPDGNQIAYCSDRDGISNIFIMNADGSGKKELLNNKRGIPIFSPDGQRIALNNSGNLVLINIDGTNFFELTSHSLYSIVPPSFYFSSDGSILLFSCDWYNSGNFDVCTINSDGSNLKKLTIDNDSEGDQHPRFSFDENNIVYDTYDRSSAGTGNICTMDTDGNYYKNLTTDSLYYPFYPVYSPDGSKILFTAEGKYFTNNTAKSTKGRPAMFSMNADGTNPIQISDVGPYTYEVLFLPNGFELIFPESRQIVCDNFEGTNRRIISDISAGKLYHSGQYIYLISWSNNTHSIYRMNLDGSNAIVLSDQDIYPYYLSIQPIIQ